VSENFAGHSGDFSFIAAVLTGAGTVANDAFSWINHNAGGIGVFLTLFFGIMGIYLKNVANRKSIDNEKVNKEQQQEIDNLHKKIDELTYKHED
jgi:hypothetical protein